MRIVSTRVLRAFYEAYPESKKPIQYWVSVVRSAEWRCAADVQRSFRSVDSIGGQRYVFNLGGNKFRLVVVIQFVHQHVFVRFVGTHQEYDKIDCKTI